MNKSDEPSQAPPWLLPGRHVYVIYGDGLSREVRVCTVRVVRWPTYVSFFGFRNDDIHPSRIRGPVPLCHRCSQLACANCHRALEQNERPDFKPKSETVAGDISGPRTMEMEPLSPRESYIIYMIRNMPRGSKGYHENGSVVEITGYVDFTKEKDKDNE